MGDMGRFTRYKEPDWATGEEPSSVFGRAGASTTRPKVYHEVRGNNDVSIREFSQPVVPGHPAKPVFWYQYETTFK